MQLVSAPPSHSSMQRCMVASGAWRRQGNQLRENLELMLSTLPCATLPIRPPRKEKVITITDDEADEAQAKEKKEELSESESEARERESIHHHQAPTSPFWARSWCISPPGQAGRPYTPRSGPKWACGGLVVVYAFPVPTPLPSDKQGLR